MSGFLITANRQVQLGRDPVSLLDLAAAPTFQVLCSPFAHGDSEGVYIAGDLNPFGGLEMDSHDIPWQYQAGFTAGVDQPRVRKLEFEVVIVKYDPAARRVLHEQLVHACRPKLVGEDEISFQINGVKLVLFGRFRGCDLTNPELLGTPTARYRVRFEAQPYLYETTWRSLVVTRHTALISTGPTGLPSWSATGPERVSFAPGGDVPPRWLAEVSGSIANPALYDWPTGRFVWLYGLALPNHIFRSSDRRALMGSGIIDDYTGPITDLTDRVQWQSFWPTFEPDVSFNNTASLTFFPVISQPGSVPGAIPVPGTCTLYWRRGWIGMPG